MLTVCCPGPTNVPPPLLSPKQSTRCSGNPPLIDHTEAPMGRTKGRTCTADWASSMLMSRRVDRSVRLKRWAEASMIALALCQMPLSSASWGACRSVGQTHPFPQHQSRCVDHNRCTAKQGHQQALLPCPCFMSCPVLCCGACSSKIHEVCKSQLPVLCMLSIWPRQSSSVTMLQACIAVLDKPWTHHSTRNPTVECTQGSLQTDRPGMAMAEIQSQPHLHGNVLWRKLEEGARPGGGPSRLHSQQRCHLLLSHVLQTPQTCCSDAGQLPDRLRPTG